MLLVNMVKNLKQKCGKQFQSTIMFEYRKSPKNQLDPVYGRDLVFRHKYKFRMTVNTIWLWNC